MPMVGTEVFRVNMSYEDQNYWNQLVETVIRTENFLGYNLSLIADREGFENSDWEILRLFLC